MKENSSVAIKAMKTFLDYCRTDSSVFATFKPDSALLKQLQLQAAILSFDKDEAETAKEFASFILRYHEHVDYGDFAEDPAAIQRLRRYENVKYASEIQVLN